MKMRCPNCEVMLGKTFVDKGIVWLCPECSGRCATISFLRNVIPRPVVNDLWWSAKKAPPSMMRQCPSCRKRMRVLEPGEEGRPDALDVCTQCQFVWFDPQEYQQLPLISEVPEPVKPKLDPRAAEILAVNEIELIRERVDAEKRNDGPDSAVQWIAGVLGFPVEEYDASSATPWVTWALTLMISVISLLALTAPREIFMSFGMIPAEVGRLGGLTLLTSFFLHGDIWHLIGNMYFLLIIGDDVESEAGWGRYLLLLLVATLVGDLFHVLGDPASTLPCIGASGGISGLLMYYACQFPRARIGVWLWFRFWLWLPAWLMFLLWVIMQFVGVYQQMAGLSNVSALAHIGGAATGFIFWWVTRKEKSLSRYRKKI